MKITGRGDFIDRERRRDKYATNIANGVGLPTILGLIS